MTVRLEEDWEMGGGRDLELQAVPGFGFLPQKLVAVTDLLFQVKLLGSDFLHS